MSNTYAEKYWDNEQRGRYKKYNNQSEKLNNQQLAIQLNALCNFSATDSRQ